MLITLGIRYFVSDYEFSYGRDAEAQTGGFHHTVHGRSRQGNLRDEIICKCPMAQHARTPLTLDLPVERKGEICG